MEPRYPFVISGGGIAGLAAAIALKKIGITAPVFESAPELKPVGAGLGLAANAILALEELGIAGEVRKTAVSLKEIVLYNQDGLVLTRADLNQIYPDEATGQFSIHRAELHAALAAALSPGQLQTGKRTSHVEEHRDGVRLCFQDGTSVFGNWLIAAEGIRSQLRNQLAPESKLRYSGYCCWRGVTSFEKIARATSETWTKYGRVGLVPVSGGRVYWYACINSKAGNRSLQAWTPADLAGHFSALHDPIPSVLRNTPPEALLFDDIYDLKASLRSLYNRVLFIGDAAHATTPNLGQGACQALEDAVFLMHCLKNRTDVRKALRRFEFIRMFRTRRIVNRSREAGRLAQLENPALIKVRNAVMRMLPDLLTANAIRNIARIRFHG